MPLTFLLKADTSAEEIVLKRNIQKRKSIILKSISERGEGVEDPPYACFASPKEGYSMGVGSTGQKERPDETELFLTYDSSH